MCLFFFFNDTATTEIYTYGHPLSLHDALPIWLDVHVLDRVTEGPKPQLVRDLGATYHAGALPEALAPDIVMECRSEEHTSELQSLMRISYAIFCLKKKKNKKTHNNKTKIQQAHVYLQRADENI